jgi:hypothetical protein
MVRAMYAASSSGSLNPIVARSFASVGCAFGGLHRLREAGGVLRDEVSRDLDDGIGRAEVLLKPNGSHPGVASLELEDVAHVGAVPLEDGLVVVADDAEPRPEAGERRDDPLLNRVHVLVLVDDDVSNTRREPLPNRRVLAEHPQRVLHDRREVEVPLVVEEPR